MEMYDVITCPGLQSNFADDPKIYVFKNIRFAAPPVGDLRWAKPAPPAKETAVQDGSYGPICIQAPVKGPKLTGPGADSPVGEALNQFLGGIPLPSFKAASEGILTVSSYMISSITKSQTACFLMYTFLRRPSKIPH